MPGGAEEAWPFLQNLLCSISAKVGDSPCCDWVVSYIFSRSFYLSISVFNLVVLCFFQHGVKFTEM